MPARPIPHLRPVPREPRPAAPKPSRDDSELIACIRAGDDTAADELHDRLRPRVESTVRRLLGRGDADVEDLVQNAMVEIVLSIDRYRGDSSLEGWAAAIAAHAVFAHIRRRRSERRVFADPGAEPEEASTNSTTRMVVARDLVARVRCHLEGIDEAKAYTFLLHDVCGFDLREVAAITEVTVAAAQSRLVRGRREVHERLARDPDLASMLENTENAE
jgi:RNA polymerase sigma-70 factor (ECF subfamily)